MYQTYRFTRQSNECGTVQKENELPVFSAKLYTQGSTAINVTFSECLPHCSRHANHHGDHRACPRMHTNTKGHVSSEQLPLFVILLLLFIMLTASRSGDLQCPLDRYRCYEGCRWLHADMVGHRVWSPLTTENTVNAFMQSEVSRPLSTCTVRAHHSPVMDQPVSHRLPVNPLLQ